MLPEKDPAVEHDDPATLEKQASSHADAQGETDAQKPELPVDGGLECWLQVVGSFALWLNTWGIINSFGQFQTYYETLLANSPGQISWIGSIQTFLLFFIGILNAPLMDAGYSRQLVVVGNLFVVFGLMMTRYAAKLADPYHLELTSIASISHQYWHFMLAQGVTCGLGFGLLFLPSLSVLVQYFVKKRAFAITIAATGSGIGKSCLQAGRSSPTTDRLIRRYDLSHHAPAPHSRHRIPLGCQNDRLHVLGIRYCLHRTRAQ